MRNPTSSSIHEGSSPRRDSYHSYDPVKDYHLEGNHLTFTSPHVGLGISKRVENNVVYSISAWGKSKKMPIVCQPRQAYNALFGSVAEGSAKQEFVAKNNVLDFLKDDLKAAEASLAGPEREQFGAYLETFESLRHRQSRLNEIQYTLREKAPAPSDKYTSAVETDRLDAQFDIAAATLISGLTNVLTISSAAGEQDFDICFTGLGLKQGKHHTGHGGGQNKNNRWRRAAAGFLKSCSPFPPVIH